LPAYFGGVSLTEENTIIEVKAIALSYFLDVSEDWRLVVGDKWERKFLEHVEKYAEIYYPDLEVSNNYFKYLLKLLNMYKDILGTMFTY
jgi:hypothetical protein